jgi:cation transport ATPase
VGKKMNFCSNCGEKVEKNQRFCGVCGHEIKNTTKIVKRSSNNKNNDNREQEFTDAEAKTYEASKKHVNSKGSKNNIIKQSLNSVFGWIVYFISFALGKLVGGVLLLIVLVPSLLGTVFAGWFSKKNGTEHGLVKIIVWINLIAWILPVLGYFTSSATVVFANHSSKHKKMWMALGILAFALSLINSYLGIQS